MLQSLHCARIELSELGVELARVLLVILRRWQVGHHCFQQANPREWMYQTRVCTLVSVRGIKYIALLSVLEYTEISFALNCAYDNKYFYFHKSVDIILTTKSSGSI